MSSPRARSPGSPGSKRNRSKDVDFSPKRTRAVDEFGMTPPPVREHSNYFEFEAFKHLVMIMQRI